jgi:hypothetical protein
MAENIRPFSGVLVGFDWDFEEAVPPLRCPVTGQVVAVGYDPETGEFAEGCEQPVWEKIPTVLFHYIPEVGEFDYIKPKLQNEIDRLRTAMGEEAEDLDDFELLQDHVGSIGLCWVRLGRWSPNSSAVIPRIGWCGATAANNQQSTSSTFLTAFHRNFVGFNPKS